MLQSTTPDREKSLREAIPSLLALNAEIQKYSNRFPYAVTVPIGLISDDVNIETASLIGLPVIPGFGFGLVYSP